MSRTIEALRLLTEELEEQTKRIDKHEKEINTLNKQMRNLQIRDEVLVKKRKQVEVAQERNLSTSMVNKIVRSEDRLH
ncbi:hypothetical protein AB6D87_10795 [Vibrio lentus]